MSLRYSDRLSIHRTANLWAAEAGADAQDIEDDLIDAALNGEFQFPRWLPPDRRPKTGSLGAAPVGLDDDSAESDGQGKSTDATEKSEPAPEAEGVPLFGEQGETIGTFEDAPAWFEALREELVRGNDQMALIEVNRPNLYYWKETGNETVGGLWEEIKRDLNLDIRPPANIDVRLNLQIETFRRKGDLVTANDLLKYIAPPSPARWTPGGPSSSSGSAHADREARRRELAKETFISISGLRRWCDQPGFLEWATLRGLEKPKFLPRRPGAVEQKTAGPSQQDPAPDPYRTGLPGKPTIKHLMLAEFSKRVEKGTFELKLEDEAEALCNWAKNKHPKAPRPKPPSVRNAIRDEYQKAKSALQQDST